MRDEPEPDLPEYGVRVFAISGKHRFRDRGFLAYGLEYLGDGQGAVLAMPPRPGWRWRSRRLAVVRGRSAEEVLSKLISLLDVRLFRLDQQWFRPAIGVCNRVCQLDEQDCCWPQQRRPDGAGTQTAGTGVTATDSMDGPQHRTDYADSTAKKPGPPVSAQKPRDSVTSDDTTTLDEINRRFTDLGRLDPHSPWTVRRSRAGLPCYAVLQREYWARVVVILAVDAAVTYMTARPSATEDPLDPMNTLVRVDGDALTCLKALDSYALRDRVNHELTPDHFDAADVALRAFVFNVVTEVDRDLSGEGADAVTAGGQRQDRSEGAVAIDSADEADAADNERGPR